MAYKAKIQPKSPWQKDDCIGVWFGCLEESINEAFCGKAAIRCCNRERCQLWAIQLAVEQDETTSDLYKVI